MKNKKALTIKFKSLKEVEKELLDLPYKKIKYIQPNDVILFESIDGFRNFLTLQKIEILALIASKNPSSVYELAKLVGRSIAPVQKDCNALAAARFITFKQETSGRKSISLKLKFDYDRISVDLPDHPYELSFKAVS